VRKVFASAKIESTDNFVMGNSKPPLAAKLRGLFRHLHMLVYDNTRIDDFNLKNKSPYFFVWGGFFLRLFTMIPIRASDGLGAREFDAMKRSAPLSPDNFEGAV
jgi:hypothetical protein